MLGAVFNANETSQTIFKMNEKQEEQNFLGVLLSRF